MVKMKKQRCKVCGKEEGESEYGFCFLCMRCGECFQNDRYKKCCDGCQNDLNKCKEDKK